MLKWTVGSTKVTFEVVAETTAYVAVGFSHANDTAKAKAEYDAFVGGVKDGKAYGASYTIESGGDMKRENGNRYTVRSKNLKSFRFENDQLQTKLHPFLPFGFSFIEFFPE